MFQIIPCGGFKASTHISWDLLFLLDTCAFLPRSFVPDDTPASQTFSDPEFARMSVWPHLCSPSRHHLCADRFPVPWTGYLLPLFVAPFLSPRHRKNSLGIRPSILQPGPPSRALTPLHWRQPLRFPNREPFSCGKVPPGSPLLTRLRPQPPRPLRRLRPSCRRCPHAGRSRHQRPSTYRRCRAAASFSRGSPAATVPPQPRLPGVCSLHSRLSWAFHHHLQALRLMVPRTENQWVPPFSATVRIPSGASSTTLTC